MTPRQHKSFYFPAWNKCARAQGWHTQAAIQNPQSSIPNPQFAALLASQILVAAAQLARADHRGLTPSDFRHACTIVALGQDKSSLALTNREVQRVVDLFRVLAEPENLSAIAHWNDPELAEKENLIGAAQAKAPAAYVMAILKDRFHSTVMSDLSVRQLRLLCLTLNQRSAAWAKPVNHEGTKVTKEETALEGDPF
jgi:hypothetical protein